jgi:hypothetical protein
MAQSGGSGLLGRPWRRRPTGWPGGPLGPDRGGWAGLGKEGERAYGGFGPVGAMRQDGPRGRKNENKSGNNKWAARDVWAELRWAENRKDFQISDSRKWDSNQKF